MKGLKIQIYLIVVLTIIGENVQSRPMANSSYGEGYVNELQIVINQQDDPLIIFAANELQRYVRELFGFSPHIFLEGENHENSKTTILLGGKVDKSFSDQGYAIRRMQYSGKPALLITGGSARAILWAAYEVISNWGVHYLVQEDVFPDDAGAYHLPNLDIKREPIFPRREFRVVNAIANTTVFWSLDQHKSLINL